MFLILLFSIAQSLEVSKINSQVYTLIPYVMKITDFPEKLKGSTVKEWMFKDALPMDKSFVKNTNLEGIPQEIEVSFGWTLRRTNMKMYPTDLPIYKNNKDIDLNQYTLLEPFTPLAVLHTSKDREWLYVQSPFMRGWVKKKDVIIKEKKELLKVLSLPFLVVLKPKLYIKNLEFGLGAKVPYLNKEGELYRVLLPDGSYHRVSLSEGFNDGYLAYSEGTVKSLLEGLLGQPYDWGGMHGSWDCSSFIRDVFSLFGLELPRNSQQQSQIGIKVKEGFNSYEEMKNTLETLPPFRTLIFLRGHVMLYGGIEGKDIVIYHALYGILRDDGKYIKVKKIVKNLLERDKLTNIYKRVISVNVLE
jgi:hypothetical protein